MSEWIVFYNKRNQTVASIRQDTIVEMEYGPIEDEFVLRLVLHNGKTCAHRMPETVLHELYQRITGQAIPYLEQWTRQ